MKAIRIIATGGTFDKSYDAIDGQLSFHQSHIDSILKQGRCHLDIKLESLMLVDSLDMTEKDREKILETCKKAKEEILIVVHGTDTMVKSASFLASHKLEKTIVLTGAMIPFEMKHSDASFNLSSALAFAQIIKVGVYITMNGELFDHDKVVKNLKKGKFERI